MESVLYESFVWAWCWHHDLAHSLCSGKKKSKRRLPRLGWSKQEAETDVSVTAMVSLPAHVNESLIEQQFAESPPCRGRLADINIQVAHLASSPQVIRTHTSADIQWQDGRIERNVPSTSLLLRLHTDEHDFFPGDFVEKVPDDLQEEQEGVVPPSVSLEPKSPLPLGVGDV